ncbi:hypothetical protein L2E82_17599 [Cichorium intybus]|uniref:Uncharacterized protein n=1 Tax=Cichorium intybus TaxID=13427 RepID=A0ACB9F7Y6_CICIN|nr:hypothetical protein L2E82_17599 [Cichorium intybus]
MGVRRQNISFVDAVKGSMPQCMDKEGGQDVQENGEVIGEGKIKNSYKSISLSENEMEEPVIMLESMLVREVTGFNVLSCIANLCICKGLREGVVKYLGGSWILFDTDSKEEIEIIKNNREIQHSIKELFGWDDSLEMKDRFTLGEVVVTDPCLRSCQGWTKGAICVKTSILDLISEAVEVVIDTKSVIVRVKESSGKISGEAVKSKSTDARAVEENNGEFEEEEEMIGSSEEEEEESSEMFSEEESEESFMNSFVNETAPNVSFNDYLHGMVESPKAERVEKCEVDEIKIEEVFPNGLRPHEGGTCFVEKEIKQKDPSQNDVSRKSVNKEIEPKMVKLDHPIEEEAGIVGSGSGLNKVSEKLQVLLSNDIPVEDKLNKLKEVEGGEFTISEKANY